LEWVHVVRVRAVTNAARTARSSSSAMRWIPAPPGAVTFARRAAASSVLSCSQAALPAMAWATSRRARSRGMPRMAG
jgi:hypothetical protein